MKNLSQYGELAKLFHLNTKNIIIESSTHLSNYEKFPQKKKVFTKERIKLSSSYENNSLYDSLNNRKSYKLLDYRIPIDLYELSELLVLSYCGRNTNDPKSSNFIKSVPSAGGRYPLSLFIFAFNIIGIEQGIYYWDPFETCIGLVKRGDFRDHLSNAISNVNKNDIEKCSFAIVITANIDQTISKYGNRGYRHICMDVGYVSQNLYLMSSYLKIATRAVAGFYDDKLANLLCNMSSDEPMLVHLLEKN